MHRDRKCMAAAANEKCRALKEKSDDTTDAKAGYKTCA